MTGMPFIDHIRSTDPPWVQLLILKEGQEFDFEDLRIQFPEYVVKVVDGSDCKNRSDLFIEFYRLFEFPAYFGRNWDALDECITDLEWMPGEGYVLVVKNADRLLSEETQDDYDIFIRTLKKSGEEWSTPQVGEWARPGIPFHVLLTVSESKRKIRGDWNIPEIHHEISDTGGGLII